MSYSSFFFIFLLWSAELISVFTGLEVISELTAARAPSDCLNVSVILQEWQYQFENSKHYLSLLY